MPRVPGNRQMLLNGTTWLRSFGINLLNEFGLLKRVINPTVEDQMPTSVGNQTERAKRNRQTDPPETVTLIEANTKADFDQMNTKKDIIKGFPSVFLDSLGRCTKMEAKLFIKIMSLSSTRSSQSHFQAHIVQRKNFLVLKKQVSYIPYLTHKGPPLLLSCVYEIEPLRYALILPLVPMHLQKIITILYPVSVDIFATLDGRKLFEKIDLSDAHLQVKEELESRDFLLTKYNILYNLNCNKLIQENQAISTTGKAISFESI